MVKYVIAILFVYVVTLAHLDAAELGRVFGRDSLAFAAVRRGGVAKTAENLRRELLRLEAFSRSSSCQAG